MNKVTNNLSALLSRSLALILLCATLSVPGAAEEAPHIYVLGVAQDAGYPQAGCYREHCMPGWEDRDRRLGTSSIAVIQPARNETLVFDATPDFPQQLYMLEREAPGHRLAGIFLTHAHMGHYTGLMHLGREAMNATAIPVFAMPRMLDYLSNNGPWSQLVGLKNIELRPLADGKPVEPAPAVRVTPFIVPHRDEYSETVGYRIDGPNRSAVFIPDIDKWQQWDIDIRELVTEVDYALIDATFYADGEVPGRAMSEIPHPFVTESMAIFDEMDAEQKSRVIFIHMNHTNPLLDNSSVEYAAVIKRGYRVAREGMKLPL